ncbi:GNAT family N-acetyltransferase [Staphylococcus sp. NRL 16/872]|uniref:GNAT family N-acetyltransferase n=1 Tax=Staphylococcus sp. NRL 16/872 TaxID=2930131 RepID=UPI001FB31ED7|nr:MULTISPECIES: GNAT family N-acetyltransferase [unclassified Staphylococcus]MCJ1655700.1 GNAT family N-acetyltransferase [Staphylococcus sp. NRL 21/187]MCJ1661516.1 GNAT family N-acetyltransferase [Staphylococcus sp. NRL 18/288]MCJ1667430.1 GNAT family N-acetyltransferase [Staphylococcus sp. NRL 19/737]WEN69910.1 GNAT family N-acetyltransferase [Staphylococcus sp. NRL 16/872]
MAEHVVKINKNEVTELKRIAEITFYETFKDVYSQENFQKFFDEAYNEDLLLSELDNSNSFHYFYKIDNDIVGYLKLNINGAQTEPKGNEYLEIQRIYFHKAYQGGGRGHTFIKLALDKAREHHKSKIWLGVWEYNDKALAFYKRHGFVVTGEHDFVNGDVVDTDLIMERNI